MDDTEIFYSLSTVFYNVTNLVLIAAGVIIFSKKRTFSTILLLVGSILIFLSSLSYLYLSFGIDFEDVDRYLQYNKVAAIFNGVSYFVFCIAIFLFALIDFKVVSPKNEFLDE